MSRASASSCSIVFWLVCMRPVSASRFVASIRIYRPFLLIAAIVSRLGASVMRNVSQTLLGILREEISEYRRLNRLSRETIAQAIVEAHERLGADSLCNI